MKKILSVLLVLSFVLVGCSSQKKAEEMKVLAPSGATAVALVGVYKDAKEVKIVEGSELITSELVKEDSEYDVIVAPINLGCQLIAKGQTDYRLAGVLTWGNLYIVENEAVSNQQLAAFGEQAVPGKMFQTVQESLDMIDVKNVTYFNAVSDVQAQLLTQKYQYGLMAEPAATATIAKAKETGVTLKIVASLQDVYQKQTNASQSGYPQAAVFVKSKADTQDLLSKLDTFTNEDALKEDNQIEALVEEIGADVFGVPSAKIAAKTWTNQNIHYKDAASVKEDIKAILKEFNVEYSDDMLVQ